MGAGGRGESQDLKQSDFLECCSDIIRSLQYIINIYIYISVYGQCPNPQYGGSVGDGDHIRYNIIYII